MNKGQTERGREGVWRWGCWKSEEEYLISYILSIQEEIVFLASEWGRVLSAPMRQEDVDLVARGHLSRYGMITQEVHATRWRTNLPTLRSSCCYIFMDSLECEATAKLAITRLIKCEY